MKKNTKKYTAHINKYCVDENVYIETIEEPVDSWKEAKGMAHEGVWDGHHFYSVDKLVDNNTGRTCWNEQ